MSQKAPCTICGAKGSARGWCQKHYGRWRKYGDPLAEVRIVGDDEARMWSYIDHRGPDECWPWLGHVDIRGYGEFSQGSRTRKAHQVVYELLVGPIPEGMELDHTCHNADPDCNEGSDCPHRRCCNPVHLEAVTHRVNMQRGRTGQHNRDKTNCGNCGLLLSGANLYIDKTSGSRRCHACKIATSRRYRAKQREMKPRP